MLDLYEGILSEFAEAQRGYARLDWKDEDGWRKVRARDFAKKRWAAANREKQREYYRKWYAKLPPELRKRKRSDERKAQRRARYAELRAQGHSREYANAHS